jgi:hypothetical protein
MISKKNPPQKRDSLKRVSLCLPRELVARLVRIRLLGESKSGTLRRVLTHVKNNPPWIDEVPKLNNVKTVSTVLPQKDIEWIDSIRYDGESRSKCVTKLIQIFFKS